MKPFVLKEYLEHPERKVVTRDGRAVKIHCTNYDSCQPIIAQIESYNCSRSFTEDGRYYISDRISPNDLFFVPEKKEGWINIYKDNRFENTSGSVIHSSEGEAKNAIGGKKEYITTIKIEWEE